jgi:FkbM family methyltransferase
MLVATTWGGRLLIPASDISLMPELVARGTYDVPFTAFVREHIQPGDVAIDVGANVGLFTLLLAYEVWEIGHVIAYEAHPHIAALLRDNVAMNYLDDRVEIIPRAAAARNGRVLLRAPRRFPMTASMQPVDESVLLSGHRVDTIEQLEVEAEPLDKHTGRFEKIDLIKVDVEGAEEHVFAGMSNLLESGIVRRVCFEMIRPLLGDDWDSFARRLKALESKGWRFATLPDSGIPELVELDHVLDRGWWSQIAMLRPDTLSTGR